MPRHDYRCPVCGHIEERTFSTHDIIRVVWCPCTRETGSWTEMEKLPSAPNFTIKGFNAKNGYSK